MIESERSPKTFCCQLFLQIYTHRISQYVEKIWSTSINTVKPSNMFFVVQKNHVSTSTTTMSRKTWSWGRSRVLHVPYHLFHVVFPIILVLISSSLITLVICSSSSSSNIRRNTREIFDQDNKIDFLKIRVLHTNDLHSRFDEVRISGSKCKDEDRKKQMCYGGEARIKHMVDSIRTQQEPDDNVLFLNAGDFFQVCWIFILIL